MWGEPVFAELPARKQKIIQQQMLHAAFYLWVQHSRGDHSRAVHEAWSIVALSGKALGVTDAQIKWHGSRCLRCRQILRTLRAEPIPCVKAGA